MLVTTGFWQAIPTLTLIVDFHTSLCSQILLEFLLVGYDASIKNNGYHYFFSVPEVNEKEGDHTAGRCF
jgi:hypothetical protein